jgi:hypothetical protein
MMRSFKGRVLAAAIAMGPLPAHGEELPGETSVTVHFDPKPEKEATGDDGYLPRIEELFQSGALVNGINSGADAINRSVESLMEAVFYNLMDHEVRADNTRESWISLLANRNVFSTSTGSYVIVDKIAFGPRYLKELWKIHDVPISLGADGSVEMLEIYPRSDAARLSEQRSLPRWRQWANNWFGILPLLTRVLPPSFNPNELYDPIRQIESPFSFPLTIESFKTMPIGSIRSYGISGGVQVPLGVGDLLDIPTKKLIAKVFDSTAQVPYTVFSTGTHRINVLRRGENLAWVGLSNVTRSGQSLAGIIGNTLYLMQNAVKHFSWAGVPLPLFPIDIELSGALSKKFDQLYEFDLSNPKAASAYLTAVRGDFAPSGKLDEARRNKGENTGVRYHFTKVESSTDASSKNYANVFVARRGRRQNRSKSEIEIRDESGVSFVLEGAEDQQDERWDLLVGHEESRVRNQVDLKVNRQENLTDQLGSYVYTFKDEKNALAVSVNYNISDRYADTEEYESYIAEMKRFLQMPLGEVPAFPLLNEDVISQYRKRAYLDDPAKDILTVAPTPTVLGRINANAAISFDTQAINNITSRSVDEMWGAFAKAFGMNEETWRNPNLRAGVATQLLWFRRLAFYPLRLFNVRVPSADAIQEAQNSIAALVRIKATNDPSEKLEGFYQLFESDHPKHVAAALLHLSDLESIPRKVQFFARPVGYLDPAYKVKFQKLDGLEIRSAIPFQNAERYEIAKDKLNAFFPSEIRELRERPAIRNIEVASNGGIKDGNTGGEHPSIFVRVQADRMALDGAPQVYVRLEQGGKVQFGKLVVAEDVVPLILSKSAQASPGADLGTSAYEFFLSGPSSPLDSFILNQALEFGGELILALSVSSDGSVWSPESEVRFRYEDGRLYPPD